MTSIIPNPPAWADAYKLSHKGFLPKELEYQYSNMTARSSKHAPVLKEFYDDKVVFFGLQRFLKKMTNDWDTGFFSRPKNEVIARFKRRTDTFLGADSISMTHFEELHDLGYLPISIKALPEGARVNLRVPLFTIINTHPRFAWLTNYLETLISCETWKPITTATIAFELRKMLTRYAIETTGSAVGVEFSAHGFEFRGMSGVEDAAISGAGHLLSFWGTDTIPAIEMLEDYYGANAEKELIAASVPASEHMVTCLGIALGDELSFFRKAITEDYPTGIVSLVSDTLDFFKVITTYATALKREILDRKPNAIGLSKVVFRPDSGNPADILCGDPTAPVGSPEFKGAVECLWNIFGGTISSKGFKVLHERTGLIYGDSINQKLVYEISERLKAKGFASTNSIYGIGSYTYNLLTRDCFGMAIKGTWAQVGGKDFELFKTPKTDSGLKNSARGLLRVDRVGDDYILRESVTRKEEAGGELREVYRDGKLIVETTLAEMRARINADLSKAIIC